MRSWIDDIRKLVKSRKWEEVLSLGEVIPVPEKPYVLWVWPTQRNIIFLRNIFNDIKPSGILSIGCGSGLLEWILQESTGVPTAGVELGSSWWTSNYCPQPFIKLNFINDTITPQFLQKAIGRNDWDFVLLFCYFNDRPVFLEYVKAYMGSCLVIIGALRGTGKHTDPPPFDIGSEFESEWQLYNSCEVGNTKDYIAVYIRKGCSFG